LNSTEIKIKDVDNVVAATSKARENFSGSNNEVTGSKLVGRYFVLRVPTSGLPVAAKRKFPSPARNRTPVYQPAVCTFSY